MAHWGAAEASLVAIALWSAQAAAAPAPVPRDPPARPDRVRVRGFPVLGYTPETSVAGAAVVLALIPNRSAGDETSTVFVSVGATLREQWIVNLTPTFALAGGRGSMFGELELTRWEATYAGVGPDAPLANREVYVPRSERLLYGGRVDIGDAGLSVGGRVRMRHHRILSWDPDGALSMEGPPGVEDGWITAPGLLLQWDTRDAELFPTDGGLATLWAECSLDALGADFGFCGAEVDARLYRAWGVARHVVAGQARAELQWDEVPFYDLSTFGGRDVMRGIGEGRYRDDHAAAVQVEYRSPSWGPVGFATFGGLATVWHGARAWEPDDTRWATGAGLRFALDRENRINMRLDYALTRDEFSNFYVSLLEAF